jgi:hypothetical protein
LFLPFSVQFLLASATTREPDQVIKIALIAAILAHQHDPKAVWVNNGDADPVPVRICTRNRRNREPGKDSVDSRLIAQIQDKQSFRVRCGRRSVFGCGELQVGAAPGQVEHYTVVTGVSGEVVDLG